MILVAGFIFLSLLSVIRPKSNKVFVCLVIFTWFVAAFCTQHVYRIHRYLLVLGYIAATSYNTERCKRRLINTTFFYVILMITVWLIFYIQICRLNSYDGTFFALFHNNKFIH